MVRVLLEHKADVDKAKGDGVTPLYIASENGHLDVVRVLLEHKADVNKARDDGGTPLYIASQNGHLDMVRVLLEAYADVDHSAAGYTLIMIARHFGHSEVVQLLSAHGASNSAS
jgi:serine/threonine-protein phosphatase 6 regulatory ankyrin repeat subunit B